jgi:hypothetical protein
MRNRYTVDNVMNWWPCYDREEIKRLFGRRRSVTLIDILSAEKLADEDAIWCACRVMGWRQCRLFGADCAESVVRPDDDAILVKCIEVVRLYADGRATDADLRRFTEATFALRGATVHAAYGAAYSAYGAAVHSARAAGNGVRAAEHETQRHALLTLALAGEVQ